MVVATVPASKHVCVFCERQLLVDINAGDGSFMILCSGCEGEMIDCHCKGYGRH